MSVQKVTLSLPADLTRELRKRTKRGEMSRYVAEAIRSRIEAEERERLRAQLREGYQARASVHRELADEFFTAEEEAFETSLSHDDDPRAR